MHAVDIAGLAVVATVTSSGSPKTIAAPNMNRRGLLVYNGSDKFLFIKYGSSATSALFTGVVPSGGLWEMPRPIFVGLISAVSETSPTGDIQVTELS